MVDTRVQFWDKESGKGSIMISFIFLFVLFKVLVLSVNSHWDGTNCVRSASGLSQTFALEIVYLNEFWGHIHLQMV